MVRVNVIEVKPAAVCLNNATVGVTLKNSNVLKGEAAARAAAAAAAAGVGAAADDAGRLPQRRHSRRLASTRGLRRPAPQPPGAVNGVPHGAPCANPLPPLVNSGGSPPAPVPRTPAPAPAPTAKQLAPRPTWQVGAPSSPHRPPSSASASPAPSASPLSSPSQSPSLSVTMSPSPSLSLATPSSSLASSTAPQPCGWVRVFVGGEAEGEASAAAAGPGAGAGAAEERGTLVYLTATSTVRDVCRDLLLSDDLTLWVQYGGGVARRLRADEAPLRVQEACLRALGVGCAARRARLGVDPELRHVVRFRAGPGPAPGADGPHALALAAWGGWARAAHLQLLKGLVFPQWRRRPVALLGHRLFLYPGSPGAGGPEVLELSGGAVSERAPRHGRLVLRVTPGPGALAPAPAAAAAGSASSGSSSAGSSSGAPRHVFLGFAQPWERDLWRRWLDEVPTVRKFVRGGGGGAMGVTSAGCEALGMGMASREEQRRVVTFDDTDGLEQDSLEAVQMASCPERLDLSDGGLERLPESLASFGALRELSLARNRLGAASAGGECDAQLLARLPLLRALSLAGNALRVAPCALLRLAHLHTLDLSDNALAHLPADIDRLTSLQELRVERNQLRELPAALSRLGRLRALLAAHNRLSALPPALLAMRALALLDLQGNRVESGRLPASAENGATGPPGALSRVNLRANLLKGCIVLGNYGGAWREELCAPAASPPPRAGSAPTSPPGGGHGHGRGRRPAPGPPIRDRKHRLFSRPRAKPVPAPALPPGTRHWSLKESAQHLGTKAKSRYLDYFRRSSFSGHHGRPAPAPAPPALFVALPAPAPAAAAAALAASTATTAFNASSAVVPAPASAPASAIADSSSDAALAGALGNFQYQAVVRRHKDILPRIIRGPQANLQLRLQVSQELQHLRLDGTPFQNLTQLDVSENSIESLDLSALTKLESVQCSRNRLSELALNGKALVSLIAGNNRLQKLTISPAPTNLKHLDVSYNELETLPAWLAACTQLRVLFASHNHLRALPDHLFCGDGSSLHTLQLSYNQLSSLPAVVRPVPLQELFLQSNSIAMLPPNFLRAASRMRVLNMSNNRLCELPPGPEPSESAHHQLEKLYLTANCLTDSALEVIGRFANLRILHAAYNCITTLSESCVAMWKDLEELVLSGNKLQYLPDNLTRLEHLRVLRVHSNRLQASPCFAKMTSLKVLDLAHNQLDRVNLATLVPQQLQFLDLSCNSRLYVDPRQFQVYRTHRPMSLVDVSGQNRTCLPSTPFHEGGGESEPPWRVGFSETAGLREKLYITQIRLPAFCNTEGLFGLFDGGNNNDIPNILIKAVPRILLEERTVKETAEEYMKYTMLSAHRELKEKGQKYGVCATLCHISRTKPGPGSTTNGFLPSGSRYVLRVASVGEAGAVLCRRSEGIQLCPPKEQISSPPQTRNQLGCSAMFPLVIPDPRIAEVQLEEEDEFLIVANKRFWEVVSVEEAVEEARHMGNAILAAKKLQDLAQSYGSEENLSIMVIRFSHTGSDMDQLMRELRHTIRRGKQQQHQLATDDSSQESSGPPKCFCQNISNGGDVFYNNGLTPVAPPFKPGIGRTLHESRPVASRNGNIPDADRSSPSGQSDHASSDCTSKKCSVSSRRPSIQHSPIWSETNGNKTSMFVKTGNNVSSVRPPQHQSVLMHENGTKKISAGVQGLERRSYRDSKRSGGGVLKAIRAKLDSYSNGHLADTEGEETGSDRSACTQPSEEQFKCWEYMLEQNTQMLFDKELDTLSRSGLVRPSREPLPDPLWPRGGKALSRSSPHLAEASTPAVAPFLSRHFGSARSFNPVSRATRFGSGRFLNGGPNAAYFGSLQRLMPYNLEYNFAVIQERAANQDSLEQDGRMQQYWGVATTEL